MKRRNLILLLGGASSGAMSVGTGAFSSVDAEREVEVNVVEDDEAYLGLTADLNNEALVRVTNQFASALELTLSATVRNSSNPVEVKKRGERVVIEINSGGNGMNSDSTTVDIRAGRYLDVSVECRTAGTYYPEISFHGEVNTNGTTIDKTRDFKKTTVTSVRFPGNSGKASIESSAPGTVGGTAYYRNDGIEMARLEKQKVGEKFGPKKTEGIDGDVVAVKVDGVEGTFWKKDIKNGTGNAVDRERAAKRDGPPSE